LEETEVFNNFRQRLLIPPVCVRCDGPKFLDDYDAPPLRQSSHPYERPFQDDFHRGGGPARSGGFSLPSGMKPGDWICTCGDLVYGSRADCRQCGALKPVPAANFVPPPSRPQPAVPGGRFGDWTCPGVRLLVNPFR
jgi:hypothetical protein